MHARRTNAKDHDNTTRPAFNSPHISPRLNPAAEAVKCSLPRLLVLLLLLLLPAEVQAQFLYTTNDGTITVTGYTGSGGAVTIPEVIDGLPVTGIGDFAFNSRTSLTNITMPNSITSIGEGAFWHCSSLTSFAIPQGVTSIGYRTFDGCTSLAAITVHALNSVYMSVDGVLFDGSRAALIQYPAGKSASGYTIPSNVTNIGDSAFAWCNGLINVTIPASVTNIGRYAFLFCSSLKNVTTGSSVTAIGSFAFFLDAPA